MNAYKAAQKIWRDLYLLCNYVGAWEIKIRVGLLLPFLPSPAPTPGLCECAQLSRESTPFSFAKPLLKGATIWPRLLSSLGNGRARFTAMDRMPVLPLAKQFHICGLGSYQD